MVEFRNKMSGCWYWLQKCKRLLEKKMKGLVEVVDKGINTIINEVVARNMASEQCCEQKIGVGHKQKLMLNINQRLLVDVDTSEKLLDVNRSKKRLFGVGGKQKVAV